MLLLYTYMYINISYDRVIYRYIPILYRHSVGWRRTERPAWRTRRDILTGLQTGWPRGHLRHRRVCNVFYFISFFFFFFFSVLFVLVSFFHRYNTFIFYSLHACGVITMYIIYILSRWQYIYICRALFLCRRETQQSCVLYIYMCVFMYILNIPPGGRCKIYCNITYF